MVTSTSPWPAARDGRQPRGRDVGERFCDTDAERAWRPAKCGRGNDEMGCPLLVMTSDIGRWGAVRLPGSAAISACARELADFGQALKL